MAKETVTISKKEYIRLKKSHSHLSYLEVLGVDNWEGYCRPDFDDDGNVIDEDGE